MNPQRPSALALLLAGLLVACHPVPEAPAPGAPESPEPLVARPGGTLVVDPGPRGALDVSALVEGDGSRYDVVDEAPPWLLRVRAGATGAGPREIRMVSTGLVSRTALLALGELDAADLDEADLESLGPEDTDPGRLHRFADFDRIVLRFGPSLSPPARTGLWKAVDRVSLADVLFPRTGGAAEGCLPGRPADPPATPEPSKPEGSLTLLFDRSEVSLQPVARRVAASWSAAGARTEVEPLAFPVLRDRLLAGRFQAALLVVVRPPAGRMLPPLDPWVCPAGSPGESEVAALEVWLRQQCGLFPLLSRDRVVAARPGLAAPTFDQAGRARWDRTVSREAP